MLSLVARRTGRLTRAFQIARAEAVALGAPVLGTEHLLLGLVREGRERDDPLLADVDPDRIRGLLPAGTRTGPPPFSARAVRAVAHACRAGGEGVEVRHLLAGVLADPGAGAVDALDRLGTDTGDLWARALRSG